MNIAQTVSGLIEHLLFTTSISLQATQTLLKFTKYHMIKQINFDITQTLLSGFRTADCTLMLCDCY